MPDYSKNIIYLSEQQRQELFTNDTITVNGVTINYNENDIYLTPQEEPVTDVRIDGTSISNNGIANIPKATTSVFGAASILNEGGLTLNSEGRFYISTSSEAQIKAGTGTYKPLTAPKQHMATFYGLSKVAGVDLANETVTLGTYPDSSKAAIQNMLGITDLLSTEETTTATAAHALNSLFLMGGKLYKATAAIAIGDAVVEGTNCQAVKVEDVFVKRTDYANSATPGVIRVGAGLQMAADGQRLYTLPAHPTQIKGGTETYKPIDPAHQHESVFYGLSKVAGVDLANETVTLGTYPETSKAAIRSMLGAASPDVIAISDTQPTNADTKVWLPETQAAGVEVPTMADMNTALAGKVSDVQISGTSIVSNGIATIPVRGNVVGGSNDLVTSGGIHNTLTGFFNTTDSQIKGGTQDFRSIAPITQHKSVFYGLAKAAGADLASAENITVGTYPTTVSAAIRSMLGAVGTEDKASSSTLGLVKVSGNGIAIDSGGAIYLSYAGVSSIKAGNSTYSAITTTNQHQAVFYGLAKAAGDTTMASSSNTVGTYTDSAKASIKSMLGIVDGSTGTVDITGTTPSITAVENTRYVCGEVSTLSFTPSASGICIVRFTSGSTATVLTVPNTVKFPEWFDITALEADTIYEICITDGIYGAVMSWAL